MVNYEIRQENRKLIKNELRKLLKVAYANVTDDEYNAIRTTLHFIDTKYKLEELTHG
jgi:hypothetical protein